MQILKTIIIGRFLPINDVGEVVLALSLTGGMESGMSSLFNDDIYSNITDRNGSDAARKVRSRELKYNCVLALILVPLIFLTTQNKFLTALAVLLPLNSGIGAAKAISTYLEAQQSYSKIEFFYGCFSLILFLTLIPFFGVIGFVISIILSYIANQMMSQYFIIRKTAGHTESFNFLEASIYERVQILMRVIANSFNNTIDNMTVGICFTPSVLGNYSIMKSTMAFGTKIANPIVIWSHTKSVRQKFDVRSLSKHVLTSFIQYGVLASTLGLIIGIYFEYIVEILYSKQLEINLNKYVVLIFLVVTRYCFVCLKPFMAKHTNRKRSLIFTLIPLAVFPILISMDLQMSLVMYTCAYGIISIIYLFNIDERIHSWLRSF